jgi:hypothetical protein
MYQGTSIMPIEQSKDNPNPQTAELVPVTQADAIRFLETAVRNWSHVPVLSNSDVDDVRSALQAFARHRLAHAKEQAPVPGEQHILSLRAMRDVAVAGNGFREALDFAIAALAANPVPGERVWTPHLDYAGEPMREGEFRDAPEDNPVPGDTGGAYRAALEQIASNNWRDQSRARHVARQALAHAAPALGAERICREAAQWELAQAATPGIGKKTADNHRSAAHALEMVADKIAAHAAPTLSDEQRA